MGTAPPEVPATPPLHPRASAANGTYRNVVRVRDVVASQQSLPATLAHKRGESLSVLFCFVKHDDEKLTCFVLLPHRRPSSVIGADATSVTIALPRRSDRLVSPAAAENDDVPRLCERGSSLGDAAEGEGESAGAVVAEAAAAPAARKRECHCRCSCARRTLLTFSSSLSARAGVGRPRKVRGRGKGRAKKVFGTKWKKSSKMGAANVVRRAAARIADKQVAALFAPPPPEPVKEVELRGAIGVLIKRKYSDAEPSEHAAIAKEVAKELQCDERTVLDVWMKLAEGNAPEKRRPGAGRKYRIKAGTAAADCILGGLLGGFGLRGTSRLVSAGAVDLPPGAQRVSTTVIMRTAKGAFGLVVGKRKVCKTGSRDVESKWAQSRLAICEQFEGEMASGEFHVEGTLFLDEHAEFVVMGQGGHNGNGSRYEWRAHRDAGKYCVDAVVQHRR